MPLYRTIRGIRYDRSLLEAAENHTQGRGESRLSLEEIQDLFRLAGDAQRITETEWRTLHYIASNYPLTEPARRWFEEQAAAHDSSLDLEKTIARIVRSEYGFRSLTWQIDAGEARRQQRPGDVRDFSSALRGALDAFFHGSQGPLSLGAVLSRRAGEFADGPEAVVRQYMEGGATLYLVPERAADHRNFPLDLPEGLDTGLFWVFALQVPALSPLIFLAYALRASAFSQYSSGYFSGRPALDELIFAVVRQYAQFPRLEWKIEAEEVERQLAMQAGQHFGDALFGALYIGIFNGESSFSFRDFIRQEVWPDPERRLDDYMREYIDTGVLHLIPQEGTGSFPIPVNFQPDLENAWAFGLEMPRKTHIRFVITSSRELGPEASWNDGFEGEILSFEAGIRRVLDTEFNLPDLQTIFSEAEYEAQRQQFGPDWRHFPGLLRQALNTALHDYLRPYSVFNLVAQVHAEEVRAEDFDDPLEYRAAIRHLIFQYLKTATLELLPIELPDNNPVDGEPVQDNWLFFLLLPDLSDHGFWVVIPRWPDDDQLPYVYGVN